MLMDRHYAAGSSPRAEKHKPRMQGGGRGVHRTCVKDRGPSPLLKKCEQSEMRNNGRVLPGSMLKMLVVESDRLLAFKCLFGLPF